MDTQIYEEELSLIILGFLSYGLLYIFSYSIGLDKTAVFWASSGSITALGIAVFIQQNTIAQITAVLIQSVSSLFYLPIFSGIFFFNQKTTFITKAEYMSMLALMSLAWAIILYRRIRLIEDTATTRLNSAAQGYSVLTGKVTFHEGNVVRGPGFNFPPMVWYKNRMEMIDSINSTDSASFVLDDGYGQCTIDPWDAEVITPLHYFNNLHYYAIYPGENIYVIGQLETLNKQRNEYERKSLMVSKILAWKRNYRQFLAYFDRDKNGKIDDAEMKSARQAAARVVEDELEEAYQEPASHIISRPADGRPFILTSIHPDDLLSRYKYAMKFHLAAWLILTLYALLM